MENFLFRAKGFRPSNLISSSMKQKINALIDEAPSNSHIKMTVTKTTGEVIEGILTIHSTVGKFIVQATGARPLEVTEQLFKKIQSEIKLWKQNRF